MFTKIYHKGPKPDTKYATQTKLHCAAQNKRSNNNNKTLLFAIFGVGEECGSVQLFTFELKET